MTSQLPHAAGCDAWRRRLTEVESALEASREVPLGDLDRLRAHVAHCGPCARSLASRLSDLEARLALRSRSVPDGLLDGFYESLEAEARMAPLGGGMSLAFLDAPRSLRVWRSAALAAGLLLVVGITWVATAGVGPRVSTAQPLRIAPDARGELIPPWTRPSSETAERHLHVRPLPSSGPTPGSRFFHTRPRAVPASLVAPRPRPGGSQPAVLAPRRPNPNASDARRD